MAKEIRRSEFEDFNIYENNKKVGTVRVKPSGILWKPTGKQTWYRVSVEQFADFAIEYGKQQKK